MNPSQMAAEAPAAEPCIAVPKRVLRALVDDATITVTDAECRRAASGMPLPSPRTERLRDAVLLARSLLEEPVDIERERE